MDKNNWSTIESLFHRLLELPSSERAAFLNAECKDDLELRNAVESLLDHADKDTMIDAAVQQAAHSFLNTEDDLSGSRIGPYEIRQLLGKGGMGAVYLAERADDQYHKQVAIKLIRTGRANDEVMQRFLVERQILATLEHPYIGHLLDGGTTDSGLPYLVMEYVEGESIDVYCQKNKLSIPERLKLFQKVCSAVQYAHQKLVVHRDLKPTNILINKEGEPRLLDFGIAKLLENSDVNQTGFETHSETRLLTPHYSSPEQIRGQPVSTVTDVYALGIILYELITGKRPYGIKETDRYAVEHAVLETDPVRPSASVTSTDSQPVIGIDSLGELSTRQIQKQLTGDLDNIVLMALRKEPERRYYSVAQFSEDIDAYLQDRPVSAHADAWSYRTGKFLTRHRFSSTLAALLLISIVGFGITTWQQSKTVAYERDLARAEAARAEKSAAEANLIAEFQAAQLADIDAPAMGADLQAGLIAKVKAEQQRLGKSAADIEAQIDQLEGLTKGANFTDLALEVLDKNIFDRALVVIDKDYQEQPLVQARLWQSIAISLRMLGRLDSATTPQNQALETRRRLLGNEHVDTLTSILETGSLAYAQGRLVDAEIYFRESMKGQRRVLGNEHEDTLASINTLGVVLLLQGKFDEAEPYLLEVVETLSRVFGDRDRRTLIALSNVGSMFVYRGKLKEALPYFQDGFNIAREEFGNEHKTTRTNLNNLAVLLERLDNHAQAEVYFREALNISRKIHGNEHQQTLSAITNLGSSLMSQEKLAEAELYLQEALTSSLRILGEEHRSTLIAANFMGILLHKQGKLRQARARLQLTSATMRRVLGNENPQTLGALYTLMEVLRELGELQESAGLGKEVTITARKVLGDDHQDLGIYLGSYGKTLYVLGRFEEARPVLEESYSRFSNLGADSSPPIKKPVETLIQLFNDWHKKMPDEGYDSKALEWQQRLTEIQQT